VGKIIEQRRKEMIIFGTRGKIIPIASLGERNASIVTIKQNSI